MLAELLAERGHILAFNMLEVGARPSEGKSERFHALLDVFPSSRLSALEIDRGLCEQLNRRARANVRYYACALGRRNETRALFETAHPMCTSLYEPDERYVDAYHNLEVMRLARVSEIATASLDSFTLEQRLGAIDFIKLDIQGAELDVLAGGDDTLCDVVALVCEVEFAPLYKGQPLYGDIDVHLRERGFMLHNFLGFGGRAMRPLVKEGSPNHPVQILWGDALFVRDLLEADGLDDDQLLKLAVLLDIYGKCDAALFLVKSYDRRRGTDLAAAYTQPLLATGIWSEP